LAGPSEQAVLAELESRRLTPVTIEASSEEVGSRRRVPVRRLGEAYGQMADLLRAGVPLLRGLKLLGGAKARPRQAAVFRELAEAVEKGSDLAQAMNEMPEVFPPVHTAMVRAGEKGGFLDQVLARLGVLVLKQADLRAKVVGNLIYPAMLAAMGVAIGGIIFGVFVPKFRPMFSKMGDGLPTLTKVVFAVSDALTTYGLITSVVLAVVLIAAWRVLQRSEAKAWLSARFTRMPVVGPLIRGFATARFCQLLGTMLSNGVPMLAALGIARDGAGHVLMERAIDEAIDRVRAGEHLAPPLARSGLFEDDVLEMIAVGESANNLDEVLLKIAETIETRLDRLLLVAVRLIEPMMLVLIAGLVGLVAGALILPMTKLSSGL